MELKLKVFSCFCATKEFTINGIKADKNDFGEQSDIDSDSAEKYGCGNMQFECKESTPEILSKYSITQSEYDEIAEKLSEILSFGRCGWCI